MNRVASLSQGAAAAGGDAATGEAEFRRSAPTSAEASAIAFRPRCNRTATARAIAAGAFLELASSATVIGAFAPCPACRARLGSETGRLLPARCPKCGVRFVPPPK